MQFLVFGRGKSLIERFETVTNEAPPIYFYGTTLSHKHLPEMQKYIGLENPQYSFRQSPGTNKE